MEEEKAPVPMTANSRVSSSSHPQSTPPPPPALPLTSKERPPATETAPEPSTRRQMFTVELKPGETTIVSWKKLLKEAGRASKKSPDDPAPPCSKDVPAAAVSVQPTEGDIQDAPPANRFSAVIEKIERLYMGEQSSDEEELGDIPDDDQYDTEDSFIDDAELDEYFQVDKLSTKHNGYFVNRGNLEKIESTSSANQEPKKRKRKDLSVHRENSHEKVMTEPVNTGNMRIKAAARSAPLTGKKSSSPTKSHTNSSEHYQERKVLKNKVNASTGTYKKQSAEFNNNLENPSSLRIGKDVALLALESRNLDKHKASRDRSVGLQVESQSRKSMNGENEARIATKVRRKEKYGTGAFTDTNSAGTSYPMQAIQPSSTRVKEGSAVRPKGTTLERAIHDLEQIVALCRPPRPDAQEEDISSQGVKRRLPQEVKEKLAKVARLSASQNKITEDDLIDRLMGVVGHLVQRKTLKRNMRGMVESGLSTQQQKAGKFQQIKQEVNEMIRTRVALLKSKVAEQQDGSADDFQEANGSEEKKTVRRYNMDTALEDKICDLYDLYVEGMDEDKGPQSRKLYVELAELWPNGCMDNYGIKDAIFRSKERKRIRVYRHKARDEERIKRKKMALAIKAEEPSLTAQVQSGQEKRPMDLASQLQTMVSPGRMPEPALTLGDVGYQGSKHHDKARVSTSLNVATGNGSKMVVAEMKKKIKRKPESDLAEVHGHPAKLPSHGKEKHNSHKDEMNASHQPKQNLQLPVAPGISGANTNAL